MCNAGLATKAIVASTSAFLALRINLETRGIQQTEQRKTIQHYNAVNFLAD